MPHRVGRLRAGGASVLAAVAVILGIVGMHAVGGGMHGSHGMREEPGSLSVGTAHATGMPGMGTRADSVVQTATLVGQTLSAAADLGTIGVAGACLAVLLGLAAALTLSLVARVRRSAWRHVPAPLSRTTPPRRGPPRDLLAELCVLRT